MTAVTLYRTDPARNMARFYHLEIQPDLFGLWCVTREWGRIGQSGQTRLDTYSSEATALAAINKLRATKQRRGYAETVS